MNKQVNICFIANFYKTFLFHELSKKLQANGANVFWIVTKTEQQQFLTKQYSAANVLYINRANAYLPAEAIDDFKLNELVYGDRVFKHDFKTGTSFLTNIQKPVYDFLAANNIRFVFGEITWAHELLVKRIVNKKTELNCRYLDCSLVRIPNKRFAFFTDESQGEMLEFEGSDKTKEIIRLEKPAYLKLNDAIVKKSSSLSGRINRVKRFISGENIEKNDPNVITDTALRFRVNSREELNKLMYKRLPTLDFNAIKGSDYIFVGFHKQPESSIDVSGRYYEDQAMNIINLWRMLPEGWKIVLKEHTNAIGDRSLAFYTQLLAYPGIVFARETTDSKQLIENSRLVATVTGTIAYEAALMQVPAITFAKVFFNRINYCRHVTLDGLIQHGSLAALAEELKNQPDNRLEFSNYLLKNTFDGYISDHVTDPLVMADENIEKLSKAFLTLFKGYGN